MGDEGAMAGLSEAAVACGVLGARLCAAAAARSGVCAVPPPLRLTWMGLIVPVTPPLL